MQFQRYWSPDSETVTRFQIGWEMAEIFACFFWTLEEILMSFGVWTHRPCRSPPPRCRSRRCPTCSPCSRSTGGRTGCRSRREVGGPGSGRCPSSWRRGGWGSGAPDCRRWWADTDRSTPGWPPGGDCCSGRGRSRSVRSGWRSAPPPRRSPDRRCSTWRWCPWRIPRQPHGASGTWRGRRLRRLRTCHCSSPTGWRSRRRRARCRCSWRDWGNRSATWRSWPEDPSNGHVLGLQMPKRR